VAVTEHSGSNTVCRFRDFGIGFWELSIVWGCGWILNENREGVLCHFTSFLG
jgi:hypothetical protein